MIIISEIGDKLYMAPLLKGGTVYGPAADVDRASPRVQAGVTDVFKKLSSVAGLYETGAAAAFVSGRRSRFAAVKHPGFHDEKRLDEFIRWSVRENFNMDKFEYSCAERGGYIYVQAIDGQKVSETKEILGGVYESVRCFDTHLFNEISRLSALGVIDGEDYMLLKLSSIYVDALRVFADGYFEHIAFDFMCAPLVYDSSAGQGGYGAQELTLMHELVKKVSRWQPEDKRRRGRPEKLYLLNAAGGAAPYYLRMRLAEEVSDNLCYVNERLASPGGAFDYPSFNIDAMCERWR